LTILIFHRSTPAGHYLRLDWEKRSDAAQGNYLDSQIKIAVLKPKTILSAGPNTVMGIAVHGAKNKRLGHLLVISLRYSAEFVAALPEMYG
jgi:hypothetical protein